MQNHRNQGPCHILTSESMESNPPFFQFAEKQYPARKRSTKVDQIQAKKESQSPELCEGTTTRSVMQSPG